jgi:hypothetical protein
MIVAVPADTPVTWPVVRPGVSAVATAVLLLLQLPPAVVSVRVMERPAHTAASPVIGDKALTIMELITVQPVPIV